MSGHCINPLALNILFLCLSLFHLLLSLFFLSASPEHTNPKHWHISADCCSPLFQDEITFFMFSNTCPKGEAVLDLSCSPVRWSQCCPHIPDGQGTAAVSSLARPPQGHSGLFALPHLQTGCEQPHGDKIMFILGLGEEYGWVGFYFFFSVGEKGMPEDIPCF